MVTPNIFYEMSPEYEIAYTKGFEDCKQEVIEDMTKLLAKIKKLEAYKETTCTVRAW